MDIRIIPRKLLGSVTAVPSGYEAHRKLICAALSSERIPSATVRNVSFSDEVCTTLDALKTVGAKFEIVGNSVVFYSFHAANEAHIDCRESKETLMLMLPFVCFFKRLDATFSGSEALIDKHFKALVKLLSEKGIEFIYHGEEGKMPFTVKGDYPSGENYIDTYTSITGLLLSLPHNNTDSMIIVTSKESSRAGADLTAEVLKEAKIPTAYANGVYVVRGGQSYSMADTEIGGDFSLASNFVVANAISSNIRVTGLDAMSAQPEKVIFEIIRNVQSSNCKGFDIDAKEILTLVPILSVYACSLNGKSRITGIKADYDDCKEYIERTCEMINSLGGKAISLPNAIEIEGVKKLKGGVVNSHSDYRISMAAAILSTMCQEPVIIKDIECIARKYPTFFDDFRRLGGIADYTINNY